MSLICRRITLYATLLVFLLPGLVVAGPIDLQVVPSGEIAEIGKNLVLEIIITPAAGETIAAEGLQIEVTTTEAKPFFGAPYPLRSVNQASAGAASHFEWAAPTSADLVPFETQLQVTVTVTTSAGTTETATWRGAINVDYGAAWSADKVGNLLERKGLPLFFLIVFAGGLAMSITPCIYPMIPITLSVIGAQSQEKGAMHGLVMSITYVVGMALVYAILGAVSATVFSGITAFMQSPVVLVPIALLLVVLSFGMFGAFELQAPAFLRDRLQGPGGSSRGLGGVFAMGMVAGVIASPCVGPFLGGLLLWVGSTGDWLLGSSILFTFGMGMGMILIAVGTFPAMLGSMPQSGGWMDTVKKGMGLLLVAMAFYFVRPGSVLSPQIFYPLVGVTTILVAVFMGAFDKLTAESGWWPRASKGLGIAVFVAGLYLLLGSFLQHDILMPSPLAQLTAAPVTVAQQTAAVPIDQPTEVAGSEPTAPLPAKVPWIKIHTGENVQAFLDEQRALAKDAGKPVMIDFWANWCVYCKKLDKLVWNVPAVVAESQRFVTIKIDATVADDAEMEKIKADFQVPGLPRIIFIDSRGEVLLGQSAGFMKADAMLELMQSIR